VLQNNQYCGATRYSKVYQFEDLADRAKGYGIPGRSVDGNDVVAMYEAVHECVERARGGGGPSLLVAETYRLSPYFEREPGQVVMEKYRPEGELEEARKRDPLPRYQATLAEMGLLSGDDVARINQEMEVEIAQAMSAGRQQPRMDYERYARYAVAEL
jgi:TPP-dependent pyruvate/acetoin dehydrogenase alpha subunit